MIYKLSNTIIRNNNTNLLYTNSYSIFDAIIKEIDDIYCFGLDQNNLNQYAMVCMNNVLPDTADAFVDHCSSNQCVGIYLHHIISDMLINDNIKNMFSNLEELIFYKPIRFDHNNDKTTNAILYGLPKQTADILNKKRKDVGIISNALIKSSCLQIKESLNKNNIDCDIIENLHTLDIEETYDILSDYKIIIDNYSYINLIGSAYCGAKVMTASHNLINEAFISRLHPESNSYLKSLISSFSVDKGIVDYLEKKYSYKDFVTRFVTKINTINKELFYI